MKTLKFIILILALLISSCSDKDESLQGEEVLVPDPCIPCSEVVIETGDIYLYEGMFLPLGPSSCSHELLLSFRDASGNDLVKGIEFWGNNYPSLSYDVPGGDTHAKGIVKRELHTLDYIYEDNYVEPFYPHSFFRPMGLRKGEPFSEKYTEMNSNYDYLYFQSYAYGDGVIMGEDMPPNFKPATYAKKITFRLTCSYLFGDDEAHDIVTWWKPIYDTEKGARSPICYSIEFDGKEITEISYVCDVFYHNGEKFHHPYSIATIILDR